MMKREIVSLVVLGLVSLILAGCGRPSGKTPAAASAGEGGEEKGDGQVLTIAEVLAARCSHGLTIECAECRYEVGVVKVDASLLAPAGSAATNLVRTIRVARQKVATSVRLTGELAVNETAAVHVSPRIPGIIRSVPVDIGARVKPEEVLFTLDSVELGAALGDYEKNLTLTALAEKTLRREQSLHEQKAGSGADVIEAQTRYEEIRAALKASEQKLLVLGFSAADIAAIAPADRASLGGPLAVRAPIGGTIIEKHAVRGELVEPGKDVMLLADLDTVWAWGGIYERDLAGVLTRMAAGGVPVAVTVPAFPDHVFTGQLNHVSGVMDEATRTVKVRTMIDNRDHRLRPGMFCEIRLLMTSDEEVLAVPKAAVLSDEGVDFVFKHMQGDYYLRQNITRGRTFDDAVEVLAGVEPGITIVTEGAFLLKSDVLRSKMGAGCAD